MNKQVCFSVPIVGRIQNVTEKSSKRSHTKRALICLNITKRETRRTHAAPIVTQRMYTALPTKYSGHKTEPETNQS